MSKLRILLPAIVIVVGIILVGSWLSVYGNTRDNFARTSPTTSTDGSTPAKSSSQFGTMNPPMWSSLHGADYLWGALGILCCANPPSTDFPIMQSLGFNLLRVPLSWNAYQQNPSAYTGYLNQVADEADALGMYIIYDAHTNGGNEEPGYFFPLSLESQYGSGNSFFSAWWTKQVSYNGEPGWNAVWDDFWAPVIQTVNLHPSTLGYEIDNEPRPDNAPLSDLQAYNQFISNHIQAVSSKYIVFMGPFVGLVPSSDEQVAPTGITNLVMDAHCYIGSNGDGCSENGGIQQNLANVANVGSSLGIHVLIGEWAVCDPSPCTATQAQASSTIQEYVSQFKKYGLANAYWSWKSSDNPSIGGQIDLLTHYPQVSTYWLDSLLSQNEPPSSSIPFHSSPVVQTSVLAANPDSGVSTLCPSVPTEDTVGGIYPANGGAFVEDFVTGNLVFCGAGSSKILAMPPPGALGAQDYYNAMTGIETESSGLVLALASDNHEGFWLCFNASTSGCGSKSSFISLPSSFCSTESMGLCYIAGIALDGSLNFYYVDNYNAQLIECTAVSNYQSCSSLGASKYLAGYNPFGLYLDGTTFYIADNSCAGTVWEGTASSLTKIGSMGGALTGITVTGLNPSQSDVYVAFNSCALPFFPNYILDLTNGTKVSNTSGEDVIAGIDSALQFTELDAGAAFQIGSSSATSTTFSTASASISSSSSTSINSFSRSSSFQTSTSSVTTLPSASIPATTTNANQPRVSVWPSFIAGLVVIVVAGGAILVGVLLRRRS
jgi:hypothetical protein